MKIITRKEWGAKPWRRARKRVPLSARRYFVLHYHGGEVRQQTGVAVPRNIEAIHLANGWSGIGYSFAVDQNGAIYEGHGWNLQGAHSPPHNYDGIGVYFAVGGNQKPSEAALRSGRWLYDEMARKTGRQPKMWWHGRDFATACPGPHLIAWAKAGMPTTGSTAAGAGAPTNTPPKDWFDMASIEDLRAVIRDEIRSQKIGDAKHGAYWGSSLANNTGHAAANSKALREGGVKTQVGEALWGSMVPGHAGVPGSSFRNVLLHIYNTVAAIAAKQGVGIDTADLATQIATQLADDVRSAVLEAGADEATAQRAADIIGERVTANKENS